MKNNGWRRKIRIRDKNKGFDGYLKIWLKKEKKGSSAMQKAQSITSNNDLVGVNAGGAGERIGAGGALG